ncbi:hypothetical protein FOZ62_029594, partial [Perkinsus olseni]
MLGSLPYLSTLFYRDALIVSQAFVSAVLVVCALLTALWVSRIKDDVAYTRILQDAEEGSLTIEDTPEADGRASTFENYISRGACGVMSLLTLVVWYWCIAISIGSSPKQLLFCLGGMLFVYLLTALLAKFLRPSEASLRALKRLLQWQAAIATCYIIQLPTMWTYHGQVYLSMLIGVLPIMLTLKFNSDSFVHILRSFLIAILIAGVMSYGLQRSCISIFATIDHGVGVVLAGTPVAWPSNYQWSTRLTRALTFSHRPCEPGSVDGPCQIYLTAANNLSSEIIINAHFSADESRKVVFVYRESGGGQQSERGVVPQKFSVPGDYSRDVHAAYVNGLTPGAVVEFWILADDKIVSDVRRFRTVPLSGQVTIAVGGDAGANDLGQRVSEQVAKYDPYAAVFAGDVSYDNSLIGCACIWDKFLSNWDKIRVKPKDTSSSASLNDSQGYMIPLIFTTGNHDLGVNAQPSTPRYDPNDCDMSVMRKLRPLYFGYFAFEVHDGEVPEICRRSNNHLHVLGHTTFLWALDSDYGEPAQSTADWIPVAYYRAGGLEPRPRRHMAVYHMPMYPGLSSPGIWAQSTRLREVWERDLFAKINITVAFEHHVHAFKRTHPLRDGKVASNETSSGFSTVFVGDGKWGVSPNDSPSEDALA